jgi:hypothetical protein
MLKSVVLQFEHGQGLIKGLGETGFTEIVRAHESVSMSKEDADSSAHSEGWRHTRDALLFCKNSYVICAF